MATEQIRAKTTLRNPERAELKLDEMVEDWMKEHRVTDYEAVDILLRQLLKYHLREICRKNIGVI